jgi:phosphate starvation-inducible protein PhoH
LYICGDPDQSDLNGKSGFTSIIKLFNDEESKNNGIYVFEFTEDDVVRSGFVKFILKKLKTAT